MTETVATQPTPGPWVYDEQSGRIVGADGYVVLVVGPNRREAVLQVDHANARYIAALTAAHRAEPAD